MNGLPTSIEAHRVNGAKLGLDVDPLIDQAHAVTAALVNNLMTESGSSERLCSPFLLSLAQAVETLLHLASYAEHHEQLQTIAMSEKLRAK